MAEGDDASAHKHAFRAIASEYEQSDLNPASGFAGHGAHYGRWVFRLRNGKRMTLQFDTLPDMQRAYEDLGEALGSVHQVNVNGVRQKVGL